jgi:hypothetical protein
MGDRDRVETVFARIRYALVRGAPQSAGAGAERRSSAVDTP